ncbi:MAG: phosphoenolpyruvate synthase, partial [Gammaproteobacteria bacterium]
MNDYVIWLHELGMQDVERVGGKNASLGELIQNLADANVRVPGGFATTAHAYQQFLHSNQLADKIAAALQDLDVENVVQLKQTGAEIRNLLMNASFPLELDQAIEQAYSNLIKEYGEEVSWAVRSSATAEDLPEASFAGQQETFLNVTGLDNIKQSIREVFASLFNDRAIAYRVHQGFDHAQVSLSAGIQKMVRSDIGTSGVVFTLDTESGFRDVVFITASYGLGEMVVQGAVNPDEFYVHKPTLAAGRPSILRRNLGDKAIQMIYSGDKSSPVKTVKTDLKDQQQFCLNDEQIEALARHAVEIEKHYGRPMDIEWALDGNDGELYIVQARPETVQSRSGKVIERYTMLQHSTVLTEGRSIGARIGAGKARVIKSAANMELVQPGDVLVTDMTDPDWEPVMKRASAIVTNRGGRTCHAAIIARELGVPAVVGCGDATQKIQDGVMATVSCAEGDTGFVYEGELEFELKRIELETMPEVPVKLMMNVASPDRAFSFSQLPNEGVGLARLEFIINNMVGIHPLALLDVDNLPVELRNDVINRTAAYASPREYFISRVAEGISTITAAFHPKPVILRMSDFKSNEYANLLAGHLFEPTEENPMIGFRGAARYISKQFKACFDMECEAIHHVRDRMGLSNLEIMIPFVRTLDEAKLVTEALVANGLVRGENGLRLIMMCELPSNALLADEFLEYFDGFSIGSNDLTQLTLGLDRDSALVADTFDER